ncbi:hypothetical protein BDW72DRAFT_53443 [Aspergillus terricola var. indicus]
MVYEFAGVNRRADGTYYYDEDSIPQVEIPMADRSEGTYRLDKKTIDEWFGFTKNMPKLPKFMIFNDLRYGQTHSELRGTDITYWHYVSGGFGVYEPVEWVPTVDLIRSIPRSAIPGKFTKKTVKTTKTRLYGSVGSLFTASASATYAAMKVDAQVEVKGEASSELDTSATETLLQEGRVGDKPVVEIMLGMNIRVRQVYYWRFNDEYDLWYRYWTKTGWDMQPKFEYETSWRSGPGWNTIHVPDSQLRRVDKLVHHGGIYYQLLPVLKNGQLDGLHVAISQPGWQDWYAFTNGTGTPEVLGPETKAWEAIQPVATLLAEGASGPIPPPKTTEPPEQRTPPSS